MKVRIRTYENSVEEILFQHADYRQCLISDLLYVFTGAHDHDALPHRHLGFYASLVASDNLRPASRGPQPSSTKLPVAAPAHFTLPLSYLS